MNNILREKLMWVNKNKDVHVIQASDGWVAK